MDSVDLVVLVVGVAVVHFAVVDLVVVVDSVLLEEVVLVEALIVDLGQLMEVDRVDVVDLKTILV